VAKRKFCTWKQVQVFRIRFGKHDEYESKPTDGNQDAGDCRDIGQGLPLQDLGQDGTVVAIR
jgi:hypothetical protein